MAAGTQHRQAAAAAQAGWPRLTPTAPRPLPCSPDTQAHGGDPLIPFSGALEAKLLDMPEDERAVYCKEVRIGPSTAVPCDVLTTAASLLAAGPQLTPAPSFPLPSCRLPQNEVQSALGKIVTAGFRAVRLIYYFTAGVQEVRRCPRPALPCAALRLRLGLRLFLSLLGSHELRPCWPLPAPPPG